jgi:hypothetical protein
MAAPTPQVEALTPMTDVWFCSNCNSINRQRDSRCYKCRAPQTQAAAPIGPDVRVESAIAQRTIRPYRSTRSLALVTILGIIVVAALGTAISLIALADTAWIRDQIAVIVAGGTIDRDEALRHSQQTAAASTWRLGLAVVTLVLFATWLSRVFANIPALGGGTPGRSPAKVFAYTLIPIWNLIKVPGMIVDALYRVEPKAGGFFMVAIGWIGLVGSWFISFVGTIILGTILGAKLARAETVDDQVAAVQETFDQAKVLDIVTTGLVALGAVVLVLVITRIERRMSARDREIREALVDRVIAG